MRRQVAVTAAVIAGLVGEWLGHGLAYFHVAGGAGLRAGLSGVHLYMVPIGLVLVAAAGLGASGWARAWLAVGRRIHTAALVLSAGARGHLDTASTPLPVRQPSAAARYIALAAPLALLQCLVYLVQENLERITAGLPAAGAAPLLDGNSAALVIQALVAAVGAALVLLGAHLLRSRVARLGAIERVIALLRRARRAAGDVAPMAPMWIDVRAARLLLGTALWYRPPPCALAR